MTDPARPYCLRVVVDVELTEDEWTILSQANLPSHPPERSLRLQVVDEVQEDGLEDPAEGLQAVLLEVKATPARLIMKPPPGLEPATIRGVGSPPRSVTYKPGDHPDDELDAAMGLTLVHAHRLAAPSGAVEGSVVCLDCGLECIDVHADAVILMGDSPCRKVTNNGLEVDDGSLD